LTCDASFWRIWQEEVEHEIDISALLPEMCQQLSVEFQVSREYILAQIKQDHDYTNFKQEETGYLKRTYNSNILTLGITRYKCSHISMEASQVV
jgi:hypothetical protein